MMTTHPQSNCCQQLYHEGQELAQINHVVLSVLSSNGLHLPLVPTSFKEERRHKFEPFGEKTSTFFHILSYIFYVRFPPALYVQ